MVRVTGWLAGWLAGWLVHQLIDVHVDIFLCCVLCSLPAVEAGLEGSGTIISALHSKLWAEM